MTRLAVLIVLVTAVLALHHEQRRPARASAPTPPVACETWQVGCDFFGYCAQHCERCCTGYDCHTICKKGPR